jgi:hypothetical protein
MVSSIPRYSVLRPKNSIQFPTLKLPNRGGCHGCSGFQLTDSTFRPPSGQTSNTDNTALKIIVGRQPLLVPIPTVPKRTGRLFAAVRQIDYLRSGKAFGRLLYLRLRADPHVHFV